MDYQPSGHDFVVENPEAKTFFVNREVFVSDEVFEREKRAIFDRCWVYVGHASELKNPGDFKTRPVAGRPIIFCRDREGTVRALINCCDKLFVSENHAFGPRPRPCTDLLRHGIGVWRR